MGKEIRKLLLINKIAEDLIKREKIDKKEAIEKTKDMMNKGKINIDNGQVYDETTGETIIDL